MKRRRFLQLAAASGATLGWRSSNAQQTGGALPPLLDDAAKQKLRAYFDDLCAWIMGLDVGSNQLKGTSDTAESIFINGNFARVLMASYRITGNEAHRDEALRWCDTFCGIQQRTQTSKGDDAGFWPDIGLRGNIYFGDAGTAAHALASIYPAAGPERQDVWRDAMERMARFVIDGCAEDPQEQGRDATSSWVIREGSDAGALGCGYYRGKLSVEPYTIATATTGGAFFSELYGITKNPQYRGVAAGAVAWLLTTRKDDGEIPYTLAGNNLDTWPLDTMSYCTEAFVAADLLLEDEALRQSMRRQLEASVQWMINGQNPDGSWGELRSEDQQRSPRALTLLTWAYPWTAQHDAVARAVNAYCAFLLNPENSAAYGIKELVRTSGFVGLAVADLLQPHCTF
ncbi:MAG TPA: hypothetical protein PLD73_00125 [Candidatus Hydrogenedentes bacterium]|jgi:hypothetical protein|nr:hypothetical protein [Candidatus Hydrogenedentota bacterium]